LKTESAAALPAMPQLWLMGSGTGSAALAAKLGTGLAMALWYQREPPVDVKAVLTGYAAQFQRAPDGPEARGCLSLSGICAETDAEAKTLRDAAMKRFDNKVVVNFCGSPERCRDTIIELAARHGVREVVIQAQYCPADRQEAMFRLLAGAMLSSRGESEKEAAHPGASACFGAPARVLAGASA
jgi:alkanesulfonate monooxygenase SsuD/methylene tetrahydromethanopterin reductase-like flavin-dependent oxidoreductase (luciferase family)